MGWESQKRGRCIVKLDNGKKADGVGTHGRWRRWVHLVPILKEEWDFNRE